MEGRAAGALLALAACIATTHQAPTVSNQTSLDLYDATSEGCYYNFQHYGEGDRIMTNEPCLNCTCHNRMLMCYLRVCPFTKPIGQDCTVEKRADQCCPIVTCPDVPVDLLTSTSTSSPAEYGATGLGKLDKYGCSINGKYFPEGSKVPPTPNKPCEHCYCIRNMTTCVMQECTLHVDGCTPIYHKDVCCPVRYSCDHPEDEMPLLDDMSTTVRPTPGFLLTTTTLAPVTQMTQDCVHNDQIFPDGTSIKTEKACEHCYCMKGDIVCVVQECGTPMENEGKNCTSVAPREGQCCPDTYICEGDEVTTEAILDYTTEPSLEKLTTLLPPRRVLDEGSGYRKEEVPAGTELPAIEPQVEGSGEEFATVQPSDETEKEPPSLIDERISSTEDVIGMNTSPQSDADIEKATLEPDSELNTVPSGTVEPLATFIPKLTTVSDTKTSEEIEPTHLYSEHTTVSLSHKDEDIPAHTTESVFRKEDVSYTPQDVTTENGLEDYTTSVSEPFKDNKDVDMYTTMKQEPVVTDELESKYTSTPTISEFSQSVTVTEIPITTASDELIKEPSTTSHKDHTEGEMLTTAVTEKTETTTLNAQENEIEDISTTQGPGRIPGEGDCLQNGVTYRNESAVPSINNCQTDCKCISSIIKCDPIICSAPPEYMNNCVPTYDSMESCCPTYVCDGSKETLPPQPHSQMSETASSTPTPAIECEGDQCDIHKVDKSPLPVPSEVPQTSDCESEDCKGTAQTPVQSGCTSEDCESEVKPVLYETPSPVASESCSDGECKQQPIEKDDSFQPCEGDNCKIHPIQPCQNEDECKSIDIPKVEVPCEGESCKIEPTDCTEEGCKQPSELESIPPKCEGDNCKISPTKSCQNEEECKTINIPKVELPCEGESCKVEPTNCNEEGCTIPPEPSSVSPTCEGDNCKISPVKPCQNEEECKIIDVPKDELPCKGESCKTETTDCNDESCKIPPVSGSVQPACEGDSCQIESTDCTGEGCKILPETVPVKPSCEGEGCISNEEPQPECTSEECKNKIIPQDSEQLPSQCYGTDCLSETPKLPEKTNVSSTESPILPQDKATEIPSVTSDYIQPESTPKTPENDDNEQPLTSEMEETSTTEKSVDVDMQTVEYSEKTDKTQTTLPDIKSTEHEEIKETSSLPELESHTESKKELESMTTPVMSLDTADKENEVSKTTVFDDLVTKRPEVPASTVILPETEESTDKAKLPEEQKIPEKTFEPEVITEKMEAATQPALLSDSKPEMTDSTIRETTTQPETGSSPELNNESGISAIPSLDVSDLETVEPLATSESPFKPTEQSISDETVPVTESDILTKEGEITSQVPIGNSESDEKITTTSSAILEVSTEETRSGTSATPELYTTSSSVGDELHEKTTETPDLKIQEPITQTVLSPKPHIDNEEPDKQDSDTTSKSDSVPSMTEPSILTETAMADTEKSITDEEKIPELPFEDFYTAQPEINTEEPSITSQDKETQQEPIEPESPDYIPVHQTTVNKSEFDMIDKETTPEIIVSTDHKIYSTTPDSVLEIQSQEPDRELGVPEIEDDVKTSPPVHTEQYDQNTQATEPSVDISPTDTRKYNKDTIDIFEPVTTIEEITTSYPIQEKLTESPTYSESTTSKALIEEEPHVTLHDEMFSTEKQDVISTETPESHVKETESEVKLPTTLENFTTKKSEPADLGEPQTPSPSHLEPKPTEPQSPTESVEQEKEKPKPEDEPEVVTIKEPEQTSEPKYDYTETPPDMIELVEHNVMDTSTLPSSISDEKTTASLDTVKPDDQLETVKPDDQSSIEKLETPSTDVDSDKGTSVPIPEDKITDEVPSTPSDIIKEQDTKPEHPEKVDSHEEVPNVEISTQKPEIDEIPTQATTEIMQTDKDYSSKQPDTSNLDQKTEAPEIPRVDHTTKEPEESVTDLKIKPEEEFVTEEPGSGEIEVKPHKDYSTEKSDIEIIPMIEQESTTTVSEQPTIDEQSVTDKIKEKDKPDIDNEIVPEVDKPTVEVEKENIPEEEIVTGAPEVPISEQEITPEQDISTESPLVPEIVQKPEIESSTEHKILPEKDGVEEPEIPITEKESPMVQESVTIEPEPGVSPDIESFTKASEPPVIEDEMKLQPSTEQPEPVKPEENIVTDKESATDLPVISEIDQKTQMPEIKDDVKPDEEFNTASPEKEYTTETPDIKIDKETPAKGPEPSDFEKEPTYESTTLLSEKPLEETVTDKPISSDDQVTGSKLEPTERITIPESESVTEGHLPTTEEPDKAIVESDTSPEPSTVVPQTTEGKLEKTTEKPGEQATILLEPVSETEKPDMSEDQVTPEVIIKEPEKSETSTPEQVTEPQRRYSTNKPELSATTETIEEDKKTIVTEHGLVTEQELVTEEPKKPEDGQEVKDKQPSSNVPVESEIPEKTTSESPVGGYDDKEIPTTISEHIDESEKLTTSAELSSTPSSSKKEELPEKSTEATPERYDDNTKPGVEITEYTTLGYTVKDVVTVSESESDKPIIPEEGIPVPIQPETEKPISVELTKDTTAPEEEFLTVTTKATTPKTESETSTHSEDLDKTSKPQETQEEASSAPTPEVPKPSLNDVQATDEVPVPEEEGHFPPSATGGYGQEPDYEDENQPFGPGTCRYGGKVYVSAQQIPRDDPCDFCFCFRSDIICLQQSCPPPIHGCHEEPIQGFCCPRYECPVSMASTLNVTTTTTTTTTTLPPHFLPHAYQGAVQRRGCQIKGHTYKVGEVVRASSGPCLHCTCGGDGQMKCDPKACTPEPMLRQMIAAAVSAKRRR